MPKAKDKVIIPLLVKLKSMATLINTCLLVSITDHTVIKGLMAVSMRDHLDTRDLMAVSMRDHTVIKGLMAVSMRDLMFFRVTLLLAGNLECLHPHLKKVTVVLLMALAVLNLALAVTLLLAGNLECLHPHLKKVTVVLFSISNNTRVLLLALTKECPHLLLSEI